jgi:hypothetical protein
VREEIATSAVNLLKLKRLVESLQMAQRMRFRVARGPEMAVNTMQRLIEFYEMVSLNDAALRGSERIAILKARLALNMFERAMVSFKSASTEAPAAAEYQLADGSVGSVAGQGAGGPRGGVQALPF